LLPASVTKTDDHDGWKTSIQTSFLVAAAAVGGGRNYVLLDLQSCSWSVFISLQG
jgi:hypothetical protein